MTELEKQVSENEKKISESIGLNEVPMGQVEGQPLNETNLIILSNEVKKVFDKENESRENNRDTEPLK